jgi:hypothetical protein
LISSPANTCEHGFTKRRVLDGIIIRASSLSLYHFCVVRVWVRLDECGAWGMGTVAGLGFLKGRAILGKSRFLRPSEVV